MGTLDKIKSDAKNAWNTRVDDKNGRYYVKGQKAQKGSENMFSGLSETEDDPSLTNEKTMMSGYDKIKSNIKNGS